MTLSRLVSRASPAACPAARQQSGAKARSAQRALAGGRSPLGAHEFCDQADKAAWSDHKPAPEPRRVSSAGGVLSAAPRPTHRLAASLLCRYNDFRPTPHVDSFGRHRHPATRSTRFFSGSATLRATMAATKIDGTAIAKKIRERLRAEIAEIKQTNPRFTPSLKIIQVGDRSDSCK
ncbi:hypothetical protein QBC34DRAFT_121446 [Podospora aff. communis PSN243]|uniref:Tetrahydrofolate dehydrogenase/cyclohydrolase catalytic domain-containing protein n=1 Tax=Podospora aff. communis PSN243 TaxID=3040156 RepID=A0AAV9GHB1_9PEZI|nr:hypothetical protein QBC34DRAFT_121446 [Podospora aff. communis PSN243]